MTVDPSDGMTFWYTQQYLSSMGINWQTRIASFNFANVLNLFVTATPDTICAGDSSQLNAIASGGSGTYTYLWTSDPPGFNSNTKSPFVSPLITTTYIAQVNDGTNARTDSITITVTGRPTAYAGPNATYPNTIQMFPVTGTATNYKSVKWLTAGDGYFSNDTILSTDYSPGANDKHNGGVLLSLQSYPLSPCADTAIDTAFIRLTFPLGVILGADVPFDFSIVPNPASGIFDLVVHGTGNMDLMVTITDIEGRTIFRDEDIPYTQKDSKIDISNFSKGLYFVKVQTAIHSITKKLVIQ